MKEYRKYSLKGQPTIWIIFCNSVSSARTIELAFAVEGKKNISSLNGEILPKLRLKNYMVFKIVTPKFL